MTDAKWKPHTVHGSATGADRNELPDSVFAFPEQRKEPLTDDRHVRTALSRFDQVADVTDAERDAAFANILAAAKYYDVDVAETDWRQLGKRPHTPNSAQ
jgi:hypothetical protein